MALQTGHLGAPIAMSKNEAEGSGEDRLIARHFKTIAKHPGAFRLEDDAAAVAPPEGLRSRAHSRRTRRRGAFFP